MAASLAVTVGSHHQVFGRYQAAKHFKETALSLAQKSYPPGHSWIEICQWSLAIVLKDLGELTEARDLLNQAYHALLNLLGADHLDTQTVKRNLDSLQATPPTPTPASSEKFT